MDCRAEDTQADTPFSRDAQQMGIPDVGGKMDDIGIVIAYVVPAAKI